MTAIATPCGHARVTRTDFTSGSEATRLRTAPRSSRASGSPIGTRAASRTWIGARASVPVTDTFSVVRSGENHTA